MRRLLRSPNKLLASAVALTLSLALVPTAYASAPGGSNATANARSSLTRQDPTWLKAKLAYHVYSGIVPGQGKGAHTHPVILKSSLLANAPKAASLVMNSSTSLSPLTSVYTNGDLYTAEPGNGVYPSLNFPGGGSTDDLSHPYNDAGYFLLCGPGSADVALFNWPLPTNYAEYDYVKDPFTGATSSWKGTDVDGTIRMRGYLLHLAFQIKAPTWSKSGMIPQTSYQLGVNSNKGATLQVIQDALNWEASGENSSNWASYFYTTQWNSAYYNANHNIYPANLYSALHSDIVADIAGSGVPVIVEIPMSYLPNAVINAYHFVAIVGYDDNAGTYTYIDTCKGFTHCDAYYNGSTWVEGQDQPDLHPISQSQLAVGVASISTNQATGDGGWVW